MLWVNSASYFDVVLRIHMLEDQPLFANTEPDKTAALWASTLIPQKDYQTDLEAFKDIRLFSVHPSAESKSFEASLHEIQPDRVAP